MQIKKLSWSRLVTSLTILFALATLTQPTFAGLLSGDQYIIIKKGGDSNVTFTGGTNQELCYWDTNTTIKPATKQILGVDTFVKYNPDNTSLDLGDTDINLTAKGDSSITKITNYGIDYYDNQGLFGDSHFGMGVDIAGNFELLNYTYPHYQFVVRDSNLKLEKCLLIDNNYDFDNYYFCGDAGSLRIKSPVGGTIFFEGDYVDFTNTSAVGPPQSFDGNLTTAMSVNAGQFCLTGNNCVTSWTASSTDTNWQTSWTTFDANIKATYKLPWADTNWQTSYNLLDANLKSVYALKGSDTNWQTNWSVFDTNMKATYKLPWADTNWQTSWTTFDANLKGTYLPLAGGTMTGDINLNKRKITDANEIDFKFPDGNTAKIYYKSATNGMAISPSAPLTLYGKNETAGLGVGVLANGLPNSILATAPGNVMFYSTTNGDVLLQSNTSNVLLYGATIVELSTSQANSLGFKCDEGTAICTMGDPNGNISGAMVSVDTGSYFTTITGGAGVTSGGTSDYVMCWGNDGTTLGTCPAGTTDTMDGSLNVKQNLIVDTDTNIGGVLNVYIPYGTFSSTKTQTVGSTGTRYYMDFNSIDINRGVYRVGDVNFKVTQAGTYEAIISVIAQSAVAAKRVEMWLGKNGSNVTRTNTIYDFKTSGSNTVISVPFQIDLTPADNFQIFYAGNDTGITLPYTGATSYSPSTPSAIISIKKISK